MVPPIHRRQAAGRGGSPPLTRSGFFAAARHPPRLGVEQPQGLLPSPTPRVPHPPPTPNHHHSGKENGKNVKHCRPATRSVPPAPPTSTESVHSHRPLAVAQEVPGRPNRRMERGRLCEAADSCCTIRARAPVRIRCWYRPRCPRRRGVDGRKPNEH